jgi:hypothetical protein
LVCPYAERRGPLIYCKAAGKVVNPLAFPCRSKDKYVNCIYYRQAQQKKATEQGVQPQKPETTGEKPLQPPPQPAKSTSEEGEIEQPATKGITIDGRPARNCLECIYYGERTKICLLLGVEVKDPYNPPCREAK